MRNIIEINPEWLLEIAPHYYKKSDIEEEENKKDKKKAKLPIQPKKNKWIKDISKTYILISINEN